MTRCGRMAHLGCAAHRRFTDAAGFTRHCWECRNAHGWDGGTAVCAVTGRAVGRYDSPANPCSRAMWCMDYEESRTNDEKGKAPARRT